MAATARQLGFSLLPWQRLVLAVALERAGRRPAYRDVCVSVPRQSGKSSLALSLIIWRLLSRPDQLALYSAQNRVSARRKLLHTWWPLLARSDLAPRFKLFRGFGSECLQVDNGSRLELLSATEASGHGETTDLVVVDESWVHVDATLEQATRPAMATRTDAQMWMLSTAGTSRSTWWHGKLDAARAAAEMGVTDGLACFDWSAADDVNPADEPVWWGCMPALGRLVDVATIRADLASMGLREFRRAYLNQRPDVTDEGWSIINRDLWAAARG